MGTFSQYDHPHTLARYAEVADYLKLGGNTDQEKLENLIAAVDSLKAKVGIKPTIRDYGNRRNRLPEPAGRHGRAGLRRPVHRCQSPVSPDERNQADVSERILRRQPQWLRRGTV